MYFQSGIALRRAAGPGFRFSPRRLRASEVGTALSSSWRTTLLKSPPSLCLSSHCTAFALNRNLGLVTRASTQTLCTFAPLCRASPLVICEQTKVNKTDELAAAHTARCDSTVCRRIRSDLKWYVHSFNSLDGYCGFIQALETLRATPRSGELPSRLAHTSCVNNKFTCSALDARIEPWCAIMRAQKLRTAHRVECPLIYVLVS